MRRRIGIALGIVALLAAGLLGAAWWQARSVLNELHAGDKQKVVDAVQPELHRQPRHVLVPTTTTKKREAAGPAVTVDPEAQTILLIGSDHRWEQGGTARSDTILLVRVDPTNERIALLSIPRDLYVEIPGHGHDRINEAFHLGGEKLLTKTVRETFGVTIDHFVEVDFHGFKNLVSTLGGVYVPVDQRYFNENVGTPGTNYANIDLKPGYQKLDGAQALAFARYRHTDSDLVRAARQQLLLREATRQVLKHRYDVLTIRSLAQDFAKATTSDISSLREVWTLAETARRTPASRLVRLTVPSSDYTLGGAAYLRATPDQLKHTVERWLGVEPGNQSGGSEDDAAQLPDGESAAPQAPAKTPQKPALDPDGGRGAALVHAVRNGIRTCKPSALPPRYWWPESWAARNYVLDGHPSIALAATAGSGRSILWTFTTWKEPPILADPTRTIERGDRTYDVYEEGGAVRQIAWRIGPTRAWITNTLEDELSPAQMLALAESCR